MSLSSAGIMAGLLITVTENSINRRHPTKRNTDSNSPKCGTEDREGCERTSGGDSAYLSHDLHTLEQVARGSLFEDAESRRKSTTCAWVSAWKGDV